MSEAWKLHAGSARSATAASDSANDDRSKTKMNWTQIEGQWQQIKGQAKSTWESLTDDDIKIVGGKRDRLVRKVQERYGVLKPEAEKQVDEWMNKFPSGSEARPMPKEKHT
jgi:uncharacterized protein YjbJ (UPF0337 family)